jgi:hypothetical protein
VSQHGVTGVSAAPIGRVLVGARMQEGARGEGSDGAISGTVITSIPGIADIRPADGNQSLTGKTPFWEERQESDGYTFLSCAVDENERTHLRGVRAKMAPSPRRCRH